MKTSDDIRTAFRSLLELIPQTNDVNQTLTISGIIRELEQENLYLPDLSRYLYDLYHHGLMENQINEETDNVHIAFANAAKNLLSSENALSILTPLDRRKLHLIINPPYTLSLEEVKEIIQLNLKQLPDVLHLTNTGSQKKTSINHKASALARKFIKKEPKAPYCLDIFDTLKDNLNTITTKGLPLQSDLKIIVETLTRLHGFVSHIQDELISKGKTSEALQELDSSINQISDLLIQHGSFKAKGGLHIIMDEHELVKLNNLSNIENLGKKAPF